MISSGNDIDYDLINITADDEADDSVIRAASPILGKEPFTFSYNGKEKVKNSW